MYTDLSLRLLIQNYKKRKVWALLPVFPIYLERQTWLLTFCRSYYYTLSTNLTTSVFKLQAESHPTSFHLSS